VATRVLHRRRGLAALSARKVERVFKLWAGA